MKSGQKVNPFGDQSSSDSEDEEVTKVSAKK